MTTESEADRLKAAIEAVQKFPLTLNIGPGSTAALLDEGQPDGTVVIRDADGNPRLFMPREAYEQLRAWKPDAPKPADAQQVIEKFLWRTALQAELCEEEARDAERIAQVIQAERGVRLSTVEAALFWEWRSKEYDAGWLTVGPDSEIVRWFDILIAREREG